MSENIRAISALIDAGFTRHEGLWHKGDLRFRPYGGDSCCGTVFYASAAWVSAVISYPATKETLAKLDPTPPVTPPGTIDMGDDQLWDEVDSSVAYIRTFAGEWSATLETEDRSVEVSGEESPATAKRSLYVKAASVFRNSSEISLKQATRELQMAEAIQEKLDALGRPYIPEPT